MDEEEQGHLTLVQLPGFARVHPSSHPHHTQIKLNPTPKNQKSKTNIQKFSF
jgi:hypothetical protein